MVQCTHLLFFLGMIVTKKLRICLNAQRKKLKEKYEQKKTKFDFIKLIQMINQIGFHNSSSTAAIELFISAVLDCTIMTIIILFTIEN